MRAKVGDRITVRGHKVGQPNRQGEIIEVRGPDGAAPYLVQWDGEAGEHIFYPGNDAIVG